MSKECFLSRNRRLVVGRRSLFRSSVLARGSRAQVGTVDFILGLLIVVSSVVFVIGLLQGLRSPSSFDRLRSEALTASDILVSEGFPSSWNVSSVVQPGLLEDDQVSLRKLSLIPSLEYDVLRDQLGGVPHIYWYFENGSGVVNLSRCGFGDPEVVVLADCSPQFPVADNRFRLDRYVLWNDSLLRMVVVAWS